MIDNPNPKKYKIKKLRGKGYVLVDRQIDRWSKKLKPDEFIIDYKKSTLGRPKGVIRKPKLWKMFE